jgi:hypothetical protein
MCMRRAPGGAHAAERQAAAEVSERGWYCARCAIVYFQPGGEPPGAHAEYAYSVEDFRRMMFSAGGYGDRA